MCGMITATFLGIYLIPLSFVMISRVFRVTVRRLDENDEEEHPKPPDSPSPDEKQYERFSAAGEGI
jgi:hypothetical protein